MGRHHLGAPLLVVFLLGCSSEVEQRSVKPWVGISKFPIPANFGPVAESVDATDLKSVVRKDVPVQIWSGLPDYGSLVYRLGHCPVTAERGIRLPCDPP